MKSPRLYSDTQPVNIMTINSRCFCNRACWQQPHQTWTCAQQEATRFTLGTAFPLPAFSFTSLSGDLLPFLTQLWHVEASLCPQTVFGLCDKMSKIVLNTLLQLGMFVHLKISIKVPVCWAVMNTNYSLPFYISGSVPVTQETRNYKVL